VVLSSFLFSERRKKQRKKSDLGVNWVKISYPLLRWEIWKQSKRRLITETLKKEKMKGKRNSKLKWLEKWLEEEE
jgi:hypothetical protein